jgi:inner membrane protein
VGFQYVQKEKALEFGEQFARAHGMTNARVSAQPRPVSPFNWTVYVSDERAHHFAHINVARKTPRAGGESFIAKLDAPYLPRSMAKWETRARYGDSDSTARLAKDAWDSPALAVYRWFADLPAVDGVTAGSTCVWFVDLRFLTPGRDGTPFRYGACRDEPAGPWRFAT